MDTPEFSDADDPAFGYEADPQPPGTDLTPAGGRRKKLKIKKPGPRGNKTQIRRYAAEIEVYLHLAAAPWELADDVCGPVLEERIPKLAEKLAALVSRWPDVAERLIESGALGDAVAAFVAAKPIVQVMISHHVRRGTSDAASGGDLSNFPAYNPGVAR